MRAGRAGNGAPGFSLLEVMIAGFLLASTITGLAIAASLYERSMLKNGNRLAARNLAQATLELCVNRGFDAVDATTPATQKLSWSYDNDPVKLEGTEFTASVTVTPPDPAPMTTLVKDVLVTVTYTELNEPRELRVGTSLYLTD